ncbi:MAG: hypothetical protein WCJ30_08125 [Deltaproteobacteria bacterium]
MRRVRLRDQDVLEYVGGNMQQTIFGLAIIALVTVPIVLDVADPSPIVPSSGQGRNFAWIGPAFLLSLFAAVGVFLAFGRRHIRFDRRARSVTTWWSVIRRFAPKTYAWETFTGAELSSRFVRGSRGGGHPEHHVTLTGSTPLVVAKPRTVDKARRIGEEVARFARFALTDATKGQVSRREADSVDEPARSRLAREGGVAVTATSPPSLAARSEHRAGCLVIDFPRGPMRWGRLITVVLFGGGSVAFPGWIGWVLLARSLPRGAPPPAPFVIVVVVLLIVAFAVSAIREVRTAVEDSTQRQSVEADAESLRVATHTAFGRSVRTLPGGELEELRVEHDETAHWLAAISDRERVEFGRGIDEAELVFHRQTILGALAASPGTHAPRRAAAVQRRKADGGHGSPAE